MFDQVEQETEVPSVFLVDQECIDKGIPRSGSHCMVSLAIEKAGCRLPYVDAEGKLEFLYDGEVYVAKSSYSLEDKIRLFDSGKKVDPFVLETRPVPKTVGWKRKESYKTVHQSVKNLKLMILERINQTLILFIGSAILVWMTVGKVYHRTVS